MTKFVANIAGGLVIEIIPTVVRVEDGEEPRDVPLIERYTPEFIESLVDVPDGVLAQSGWTFNGETFAPPLPVARPVPTSVSWRQAQHVLLNRNLLDTAESLIAGIEDATERRRAQIEWNSPTYERASSFLAKLADQLGITPAELDELFIEAAGL